jgi:hypothetical protein
LVIEESIMFLDSSCAKGVPFSATPHHFFFNKKSLILDRYLRSITGKIKENNSMALHRATPIFANLVRKK